MTTKAQAAAAETLIRRQRMSQAARIELLQALGLAPYWGGDVNRKSSTATPVLRTPELDDAVPTEVPARALPRVIRTGAFTGRRIA